MLQEVGATGERVTAKMREQMDASDMGLDPQWLPRRGGCHE